MGYHTMPQMGLDFDAEALRRERHIIKAHGQEFAIRDDFPAEIMLRRYLLRDLDELLRVEAGALQARAQAEQERLLAARTARYADRGEPTEAERAADQEEERQALQSFADQTREDLERIYAEWREEVLDLTLSIFQHSYPQMTADELNRVYDAEADEGRGAWTGLFTSEQQKAILDYFFIHRSRTSPAPPNATDGASNNGQAEPAPATEQPARAVRRAAANGRTGTRR